ncbi:hypothetical protein RB595_002597 [Gaeumannomyces hyphopodioides]
MPGRQSHGRPLLGKANGKGNGKQPQKGKAGSRAAALDAFALAAKDIPTKSGIRGTRARDLDFEPNQRKRPRGGGDREEEADDGGDDDDDDDNARPRSKRARNGGDDDDEFGSDSDGNEWRIGVDEDDDSELDSDEAFGESDEDRFDGFAFRGSSSNKKLVKKKNRMAEDSGGDEEEEDEEDEEDDDDDGSSLGEDAIDLAQALDQVSDDDDDDDGGSAGDTESGSDDDDDGDSSPESSLSDDDLDVDDGDPSKLDALQSLAAGFAGNDNDNDTPMANTKTKVELKDLALFGVKDSNIKKSLKLMNKEEKAAAKPGTSQKLDVPLARRQQDKLLRTAAAEKANKTLDRWQDTIKHNRRAEHLVFPLPDTLHDAGLDKGELAPLDGKSAGNELEQTIMSIMEESGLGPSSKPKGGEDSEGGAGEPGVSREEMQEIWARRRREREEKSREQARAARIKKIKSKAYRRVHRRERQKLEAEMDDEGAAADSEEEREAQHRQRALERVGAKHRDSKWAKSAKRAGLAAWDEGVRTGLTEMARRDEELRRRVEGKAVGGRTGGDDGDDDDDSGSEVASGSEDERNVRIRLLQELEQAEAEQDGPRSNLMKMKFMQRAEAVRKQANDALVAQIRRELNSDEEDGGEEEEEAGEVGRRTYGVPDPKEPKTKTGAPEAGTIQALKSALKKTGASGLAAAAPSSVSQAAEAIPGIAGSWSRPGAVRKADGGSTKGKKGSGAGRDDPTIDLSNSLVSGAVKASEKAARKPPPPRAGGSRAGAGGESRSGYESEDEGDADVHLPLQIRDRELADRAFAGDDVVGAFEREKVAVESEDDDKVVDNTLPGWGSWGGEGVSNRRKKKNHTKFLTKIEGVKKKDRKDAKLERVIISEKRVRKNDKYLAAQLPHVFENKDQYERSLRLPVGPEWTTKQTFQDATKPRILMKQGIIAPMAKPMAR